MEDYQKREYRGIRNVVLAVLAAYTVLVLCQNLVTMKHVKEVLFIAIMNNEVLVKNAKV